MRTVLRPGPLVLLALIVAALTSFGDGARRPAIAVVSPAPRSLSLPFVANRGQADPSVRFYTQAPHGTVLVTDSGSVIYKLGQRGARSVTERAAGSPIASVHGVRQAPTTVNIFHGNDPARWQRNLETYETVSLGKVFTGIELTLRASVTGVEKIFTVAPGGDPHAIRMRVDSAAALDVDELGQLVAHGDSGDVRFSRPVAFQERQGVRELVAAAYIVDGNEYGFAVGDYDGSRPLIIDPSIVATYLGGSGDSDTIFAIMHDGAGHVYVTGWTNSTDLPGVTASSPDSVTSGCHDTDAFVAKLDDTLGTVIAATFLGGDGGVTLESGRALTMNAAGDIYVAGDAVSENFPGITSASADSTFGGSHEGFIVKLDANLSTILGGSFAGGSQFDKVNGLAHDNLTNTVYAVGFTDSSDFPLVSCMVDCVIADGEGFVLQMDSGLTTWMRTSFLGGSGGESLQGETASAVALDPSGHVFVAGETNTSSFPLVTGEDTTWAGDGEGFIVKLSPNLQSLVGGKFYGSSGKESIAALVTCRQWRVYWMFAGGSTAGVGLLPGITSTSADPNQQSDDGFVVKFDPDLHILAATYVGGSSLDLVRGLAAGPGVTDSLFVGGYTSSSVFPGIDGLSADHTMSDGELFVMRLSTDLTTNLAATYVGGAEGESQGVIALDPSAGTSSPVFVAGGTASLDFPGVTASSADSDLGADRDAVIARVHPTLSRPLWLTLKLLKSLIGFFEAHRTIRNRG